jgi:hypothetical protein
MIDWLYCSGEDWSTQAFFQIIFKKLATILQCPLPIHPISLKDDLRMSLGFGDFHDCSKFFHDSYQLV